MLSVAWRLGKIMKLDGNHFRKRFSYSNNRLRTDIPLLLVSNSFSLSFIFFQTAIASIFAWLMIGYSGFFNGFRTDVSKSYVFQFAFITFCS